MRIIAFSDTHGLHASLKMPDPQPGDVMVFAGDMCSWGRDKEVVAFANWLHAQPYENKVIVAGNHDIGLDSNFVNSNSALLRSFFRKELGEHYLENSSVMINGLKFWGSPVTPSYGNWAFNVDRMSLQMEEVWDRIPSGVDVLVTHGPPYGILDLNPRAERCGCELLLARLSQLQPDRHIFGHLHENSGTTSLGKTKFHNVAIMDNDYSPRYGVTVINL